MNQPLPSPPWRAQHDAIAASAAKKLFFIGASPRSGTTWLQLMLDQHPEVSCSGEGHFPNSLVPSLNKAVTDHNTVLERKNQHVLVEVGGHPPFGPEQLEYLLAASILMALHKQVGTQNVPVVGEKTPDNVRWFAGLKQLFPHARFIHLVRDP